LTNIGEFRGVLLLLEFRISDLLGIVEELRNLGRCFLASPDFLPARPVRRVSGIAHSNSWISFERKPIQRVEGSDSLQNGLLVGSMNSQVPFSSITINVAVYHTFDHQESFNSIWANFVFSASCRKSFPESGPIPHITLSYLANSEAFDYL
jgi:hypothetical protein